MTQDYALEILKSGRNVFLTGSAGTGKTYVLNQYISYLRERKVAVAITASTGIAATHMNGVTIHSWSGIGVKDQITSADLRRMKKKAFLTKRVAKAKVLIIDEISMLHKRQLRLLDEVLRYLRDSLEPFGGLQLIVSGDFFQLPPVEKRDVASREIFCFMSEAWVQANFTVCYLTQQFRQSENELVEILREIRTQNISEKTINTLQRKVVDAAQDNPDVYPHLYTHNANVDHFNTEKLIELRGSIRNFTAEVKGKEALIEQLKRNVNAVENLQLKDGAEVMFIRNNPELGVVNGTLGKIEGFDEEDGYPIVVTRGGDEVVAEPETWQIEDETGKPLAQMMQVPLRLAWAITVHKSQGMTLDAACMNLRSAFEVGQGYVALSRLRELDGLTLLGINDMALQLDPLALKADARFQELSAKVEQESRTNLRVEATKFIQKVGGLTAQKDIAKQKDKLKKRKTPTIEITKGFFNKGMTVEEIADQRGLAQSTILSHLLQLKKGGHAVDIEHLKPEEEILIPVREAVAALGEDSKSKKAIHDHLKGKYSYDDISLCLLFVP